MRAMKYKRLQSSDEIEVGMVLLDDYGNRRVVLLIGEDKIFLSHKNTTETGRAWLKSEIPLDRFVPIELIK